MCPDDPGFGTVDDVRMTELGYLLEARERLVRALDDELIRACGLPLADFEVLLRLARSGGALRLGELADQVALSPSGITRRVDRLEAAGWVERRPSPRDRRGVLAVLTGAGRRRLEEALPAHLDGLQRHMFDRIDPERRRTLAEVLDVLRRAPDDPPDPPGGAS